MMLELYLSATNGMHNDNNAKAVILAAVTGRGSKHYTNTWSTNTQTLGATPSIASEKQKA